MKKNNLFQLNNNNYIILSIIILIIILGIVYLFLNKKSFIHESFYQSDISSEPIMEYDQGYETGSNFAKKEIDDAIKDIKRSESDKKSCANSDFYTWGRINGTAKTFTDHLRGDKFGEACNNTPGSLFNQYRTEGYKIVKQPQISESFYAGAYKSGVSKRPMVAYNQGYETGINDAKKEVDNAIKNIKETQSNKKSCSNSDFYTWGRINGTAKILIDFLEGDKFGETCNNVPGSKFNQYHTEKYQIVKNM